MPDARDRDGARRLGASFPAGDIALPDQARLIRELEANGYTDLWSPETSRYDAFTPLSFAAAHSDTLRLGTAIANIATRGLALLAMSAAAVSELAPGRFCLGLGVSSRLVAEDWNGVPYPARSVERMGDVVHFLGGVLNGRPSDREPLSRFRLSQRPPAETPIYIAALGPRMARLAGAAADGVVINWVSPEDVRTIRGWIAEGAADAGRDPAAVEVVCVLPTYIGTPGVACRSLIARYSGVPQYEAAFARLGFGEPMARVSALWNDGHRDEAARAVPGDVLDELIVNGSPDACVARLEAFRAAGVDTPVVAILSEDELPGERGPARRRALLELGRAGAARM